MAKLIIIFLFLMVSHCIYAQIQISRDSLPLFKWPNDGWVYHAIDGPPTRYCRGVQCNGEIVDTFSNGKIERKGSYVNGKLNGLVFHYYENGQLWSFGQLDTGTIVGVWIYYYETGEIQSELTYEKGRRFPVKRIEYFKNGQINWCSNSDREKSTFTEFTFSEKGDTLTAHFPVDIGSGIHRYWKKNIAGILLEEGFYQLNGNKRIGIWKWYDEQGILIRTEEY